MSFKKINERECKSPCATRKIKDFLQLPMEKLANFLQKKDDLDIK